MTQIVKEKHQNITQKLQPKLDAITKDLPQKQQNYNSLQTQFQKLKEDTNIKMQINSYLDKIIETKSKAKDFEQKYMKIETEVALGKKKIKQIQENESDFTCSICTNYMWQLIIDPISKGI